jgi:hypothetical protein
LLDYGVVERFAPVDDAAYDDIRAMLATIEAAGWTSLSQTMAEPDTAPDSRARRPPPTARGSTTQT